MLQVCVLKVAPDRIGGGDGVEVGVEPKHVEHRSVGADRRAGAALLNPTQRHERHAGAFRDEGCREPAAAARAANAFAKLMQATLDTGEQSCGRPSHP